MEESQMGLFGEEIAPPQPSPVPVPPAPARESRPAPPAKAAEDSGKVNKGGERREVAAARAKTGAPSARKAAEPAAPVKKRLKSDQVLEGKKISGLVPAGDVRLTANIREDLHLKLKIASARRRTTIGEILEELIEEYV